MSLFMASISVPRMAVAISPLLQQSQSWLRQVERGLKDGVERLGSVMEINRIVPDFIPPEYFKMTYQGMLMAIPSGMDVAVQRGESMMWHDLWRESAAVMHVMGRRLQEEGSAVMAMDLFLRAEALVLSLEDRNREEWAALLRREIVAMPAVHEFSSNPTIPALSLRHGPWWLSAALTHYAKEVESRSPTDPIDIVFPAGQAANVDPSRAATTERIPTPFEGVWNQMSGGRKFLLRTPVNRIFRIYNPSVITMLDQVVRFCEAAGLPDDEIEVQVSKAIRALDTVLSTNWELMVFRMKIDGLRIDNVASRKDAMLVRWGGKRPLPEGVEVYYDLTSGPRR